MKISQVILGAAILLNSGFAVAKTEKKAASTAAPATKTIQLKDVQGSVQWTGYGVGKSHAGTINIKSGEVTIDQAKKDLLTQAMFVLDMKTLNTKDSEKLTGHLKNSDFFDVEKFAEATFKSTAVELIPSNKKDLKSNYKVKGDLTIKDKTQTIEFMISIMKKDGTFMAKATTEILDRTKYGIVYHSKQFETVSKLGDKLIEDNIKLDIDVTAK